MQLWRALGAEEKKNKENEEPSVPGTKMTNDIYRFTDLYGRNPPRKEVARIKFEREVFYPKDWNYHSLPIFSKEMRETMDEFGRISHGRFPFLWCCKTHPRHFLLCFFFFGFEKDILRFDRKSGRIERGVLDKVSTRGKKRGNGNANGIDAKQIETRIDFS